MKSRQSLTRPMKKKKNRSSVLDINLSRSRLGLTKLDSYRYSIAVNDVQWIAMTTPAFSFQQPLSVIATGAADDQRGTDPTPSLKSAQLKVYIYQEVDMRHTYRIIGVTLHSRTVSTTALLPVNFFTANPAYTSFWDLPFLLPRNQPAPFKVWHDEVFTHDTFSGCQPTIFIKIVTVPATKSIAYATSDATGATATGHQYLMILADTPTDIHHTVDSMMNRKFLADK